MINGFFGEDRHTVDGKGRVFVPACHRDLLVETFMIVKDSDTCVKIYTAEKWNEIARKLEEFPATEADRLGRKLFSNSVRAELDSSGRVLIPEKLRKLAGLKKNVVIIGMNTRIEIWDEELWDKYDEAMSDEDIFNERVKFGL